MPFWESLGMAAAEDVLKTVLEPVAQTVVEHVARATEANHPAALAIASSLIARLETAIRTASQSK